MSKNSMELILSLVHLSQLDPLGWTSWANLPQSATMMPVIPPGKLYSFQPPAVPYDGAEQNATVSLLSYEQRYAIGIRFEDLKGRSFMGWK